MKIKSIEIKSYRSCVDTKLELNRELTTLIGVNGAGKSTLLNAVLLIKKAIARKAHYKWASSPRVSSNKCSFKLEIDYKKTSIYFKLDVFFNTDESNMDDVQDVEMFWDFSKLLNIKGWIEVPVEYIDMRSFGIWIEAGSTSSAYAEKNKKKIDEVLPYIKEVLAFLSKTNYYSASQFSNPLKCPNFIELDDEQKLRRTYSADTHEKFIYDLYKASVNEPQKFKLYLNTVNKFGIGLIDGLVFKSVPIPSNSYRVLSGGKIKNIEKKRILVIPTFRIDSNRLSPNQLSEGTLRALALIYYILNDESEILLVEEPEVGVHHGLLNSIIALVKAQSKNKQIVVSTHSDLILDHLEPENLLLVKKEKERGTISRLLTKTLKKNDYRALRKYLEEYGNLGDYLKEGGLSSEEYFK